jgi:hypothetical protein
MRLNTTLALALALALALSACGVDSQSNAHVFDPSEVPYGLAETTLPPTSANIDASNAPTVSTSEIFDIYFIRTGILVAVTRNATLAPSPADLVTTLAAGPTSAEVTAGHRSALTGPELVAHTLATPPLVTIDLARNFNEIPRSDRILALGQITLTLTARPGVSLVRYTIGDAPIEVPKANGVVTRDPVTRSDYTSLLRTPNSSTTSSNNPAVTATPNASGIAR